MRRAELLAACRRLIGRFDVIYIQTPFLAHSVGVKLGRELGVKLVETYHTYSEEYFHHYVPLVPHTVLGTLVLAMRRRRSPVGAVGRHVRSFLRPFSEQRRF